MIRLRLLGAVFLATVAPALGAPTRSSPIAVASAGASGDVVFVANPDSSTVARLEFDAMHAGVRTDEQPVGAAPRTLALAGEWVFTADQKGNTVTRLAQADLSGRTSVDLGRGCNPYGVAPAPDGATIVVTCQGRSELVLIDTATLAIRSRVALPWPNARGIAVASDGARAFVTHYLTEEPGTDAHVSVVDLRAAAVERVLAVPADRSTCETQNSGQGVLNLVSAIALVPDDAPPDVRGQLWVGGTQENNVSKGLFERFPPFADDPGARLFPLLDFTPFPASVPRRHRRAPFPDLSASRNTYRALFHDITRFGIYKLDPLTGDVVGKIDVDEANNATDIEFSSDGTTAYVVDLMFNSFHVFNTRKGQGSDVTTLFGAPSAFGPGGASSGRGCVPEALLSVVDETPFRMAPEAQITVIGGYDPVDTGLHPVATGVDFDARAYRETGTSRMRLVPDGVGTAPIGVRLSPDGTAAYVANYLARNVVAVASAAPSGPAGKPANFRCSGTGWTQSCATNTDCPRLRGACGRVDGAACATDADCGADGPCNHASDCAPLLLGAPVPTVASDPLPASVLDGKILFNTAARDGSRQNGMGLGAAAPLFDDAASPENARMPGSVVSTSHSASYVTCSTCHADFGGQDGRTWDFSQFGASLRNTLDLRGRAAFAPGHCSNDASVTCFFDAACGDGRCRMRDDLVPLHLPPADRERYFNPMLTIHWNGDRDEVEDFEHTLRSLMGAGDCDGFENDPETCFGALVQRSAKTSTDPVDVDADLGRSNRNIPGVIDPGKIAGIRLTHLADFVYSLTEFVDDPNPESDAVERGRRLFDDPQTGCAGCHDSMAVSGRQLFTDKRPLRPGKDFDPRQPAGADRNNPFLRHDVGTANLFDRADPSAVARQTAATLPASRGALVDYVTPVLNDVWNTRPYLHDGSAHFLLDVVRPCDSKVDDCLRLGCGRNVDELHGKTRMLTPQQLNDLTAFQKTLSLDTQVGIGQPIVRAGSLRLARATLSFGRRGARLKAAGLLGNAAEPIDPGTGVTLSLAAPAGEVMAIASRVLATVRRGRSFSARSDAMSVVLRDAGGGRFRFAIRASGPAVSALDTGNRDLTVAMEISGVSFVQNRNLAGKRRLFHLRRRR